MFQDWQDVIATVQAGTPEASEAVDPDAAANTPTPDNVTKLERGIEESTVAAIGADPFAASN